MRDLYIALSGAMAQEQRLAIVANNLANLSTVGFKQDQAAFESLLPQIDPAKIEQSVSPEAQLPPPPSDPLGDRYFAVMSSLFTDYSQGELRETMNPLDFAIQGPGFFVLETDQGERYTRAGAFVLTSKGELCAPSGDRVLGADGPIRLETAAVSVAEDGTIYQGETAKGRLRLVQFDDMRVLDKVGKNEFAIASPNAQPRETRPEDGATVRQHFLEYSNVNMINEMVRMIETERSYQMAQKAIQTIDGAMGVAIGGPLRG